MVRELENNKPPLVILDTEFENWNEPNASSKHSGITVLDDYIHQKYKETARFDPYIILKRYPGLSLVPSRGVKGFPASGDGSIAAG